MLWQHLHHGCHRVADVDQSWVLLLVMMAHHLFGSLKEERSSIKDIDMVYNCLLLSLSVNKDR